MLVSDIPEVLAYLPPLASLMEVCRRYYAAHEASQAVLYDPKTKTVPPCSCGACEMLRAVFAEAGPAVGGRQAIQIAKEDFNGFAHGSAARVDDRPGGAGLPQGGSLAQGA